MSNGADRLVAAERGGLRLAIACRTVVTGLAFLWFLGFSLQTGRSPSAAGLIALGGLTALGFLHFRLIGTRLDRVWIKYAIYGLDVAAIGAVFAFAPILRHAEVPQIIAFRAYGVQYLFAPVALACLSLSPGLVLFSGIAGAVSWWAAFLVAAAQVADPVSWSDLPDVPTAADFVALVLSPDFIGRGNRIEESAMLLAVAAILALAVRRARSVFLAQVEAEAARERAAGVLGQYVPEAVADRLMRDGAALLPQARGGVALVMDVENFTGYAAGRAPDAVIRALNDFLAAAAEEVSERGGVVISFTGDGLLAAWGAPLPSEAPEAASREAAAALLGVGLRHGFRLRVGLAAGEIAAGSVGSARRRAFTVYGETVNRAARLEALGKRLGEAVLMDEGVAATAPGARALGAHRLRGFVKPVEVWALIQ